MVTLYHLVITKTISICGARVNATNGPNHIINKRLPRIGETINLEEKSLEIALYIPYSVGHQNGSSHIHSCVCFYISVSQD